MPGKRKGRPRGATGPVETEGYALISLILVPQFARAVLELPQRNAVRSNVEKSHDWPMYSEAIQTLAPIGTAAP